MSDKNNDELKESENNKSNSSSNHKYVNTNFSNVKFEIP